MLRISAMDAGGACQYRREAAPVAEDMAIIVSPANLHFALLREIARTH